MPRLLLICEYPTLLGGERSMLATLPAVRDAGFEVHVAAPAKGPLAEALRERGIEHHAWPERSPRATMLSSETLRGELSRVIRRLQADLIHANSLSTSRISGPVAAEAGIPSVGHLRDILKLTGRAVADINLHRRIVAVSHATRNYHIAQGIDAARAIVLYNGVDLDEFQPRPATGYLHRKLHLPTNAQFVANIGQICLRKGIPDALVVAEQLAKELPDVHWLLIGERASNKLESHAMEAQLQSIASHRPLAGHVHFLGSRNDVPQILNECQLLVHSARQEPLGRVLLEAAASGVAVVATDVGGTREIFPTEEDGAVLVPSADVLAMASAVRALVQNEQRRRAIGSAGRRRIEEAFDIRIAARRLIEQCEAVVNE